MPNLLRFAAALAAAPLLAAAIAVPQTAAAQSGELIQACAGKNAGLLRALEAGGSCRSGETLLSWNVEGPAGPPGPPGPPGPQGPQGPQGPAGPQSVITAVVTPEGTFQVLNLPPGASLTITRNSPGVHRVQVSGLGNACPLPSAIAFSPVTMWLGFGSCNHGALDITVNTGNGAEAIFMLTVIGHTNPAAGQRTPRSQQLKQIGPD